MADTTSALTVQNGYSTTLSTSVNTTDTIFYLASLPTGAQGFLTIDEGLSSEEIIFYTSKGANFVQLTSIAQGRAQDGTSASGHTSGAVVKQKTNAGYWKALQDGTGLNLTSLTLPNNAVTAPMLATSAIKLGYASITSNFTTASTTAVQATGLTLTVTIPAGGRDIEVIFGCDALYNTTSGTVTIGIWDGTVGSGTKIGGTAATITSANQNYPCTVIARVAAPAAGSKTYNVSIQTTANTGGIQALTASPAYLLIKNM